MKRRQLWLMVLMVALSLSLTGPAFAGKLQNELVKESTLEQIMKRGVLRVCMDAFVPWAMKGKTGKSRLIG